LILAFANDVKDANIDKLRTAIENIDPKLPHVDPYEFRCHIGEFHDRFGTENKEEKEILSWLQSEK
jgi:hypothetical protein